jgi:hypothetical protein
MFGSSAPNRPFASGPISTFDDGNSIIASVSCRSSRGFSFLMSDRRLWPTHANPILDDELLAEMIRQILP